MRLLNETFNDYKVVELLGSLGYQVSLSIKEVTCRDGQDLLLLHIEGDGPKGHLLHKDIFPRNIKAGEDILPTKVDNAVVRFGYRDLANPITGEVQRIEAEPKWVSLISSGKEYLLTGGKREFVSKESNSPSASAAAQAEAEDLPE